MTAPRTSRDYRPPWYAPRHGVRAALRAWAASAAFVALAWALARAAAGQDGPPASVALYDAGGSSVCHAAPVAGGFYGSRHCVTASGARPDGRRLPWSIDANGRDLAHFASGEPGPEMRAAVPGETLAWRNTRAAGEVEVVGVVGHVVVFRTTTGERLTWGDSGTGIYGTDGRLVAVVSALFHDGTTRRRGTPTGAGEAVAVP